MSKDCESLDSLKSRERIAFKTQHDRWNKYIEAKSDTRSAYVKMELAWQTRCAARDKKDSEYWKMQENLKLDRERWDEYRRIRDLNTSRIESLKHDAEYEDQEMKRCFEQALFELDHGTKKLASEYCQEGCEHKKRRNNFNAEINILTQELNDAKGDAEWHAPKANPELFIKAKEEFEKAEKDYDVKVAEFKKIADERDRYRKEYEAAQIAYNRIKEELQQKLMEAKKNEGESNDSTSKKP